MLQTSNCKQLCYLLCSERTGLLPDMFLPHFVVSGWVHGSTQKSQRKRFRRGLPKASFGFHLPAGGGVAQLQDKLSNQDMLLAQWPP